VIQSQNIGIPYPNLFILKHIEMVLKSQTFDSSA